jgi:hypothetical protein
VRKELWIAVVILALGAIAPLQADVVVVPGTAVIWGAGLGSAPAGSGAILPPSISFGLNDASSISFSSITGTVGFGTGYAMNTADGQSSGFSGTNIDGYAGGGISGIQFNGRQFFLLGVFLGPNAATGAAPAKLVYDSASSNNSVFSPLLAQVFFIGDGQGSAGQQTFNVPTGATRLFWGFADGAPGFGSPSQPALPNGYADNTGSLSVNYSLNDGKINNAAEVLSTPEPSSIVLMGLGIAALTLLRRRRA